MDQISKYLKSGDQTQITPEIENIAKGISGNALEKSQKIIDYFASRMRLTNFDEALFRKRTADQIIKDGYLTGCTDAAIVFVTVARACGMPTKYVETIDKSWLKKGDNQFYGHQYAEVYDVENKKWFWVDPLGSRVGISSPENEDRTIYKEGLDSWDIGIIDLESLQKLFNIFRENKTKKRIILILSLLVITVFLVYLFTRSKLPGLIIEPTPVPTVNVLPLSTPVDLLTPEQAATIVSNLPEVKEFMASAKNPAISLGDTENTEDYYAIHVYEKFEDHDATFAWYEVNKTTGAVIKQ